jgi:hypothetical protein
MTVVAVFSVMLQVIETQRQKWLRIRSLTVAVLKTARVSKRTFTRNAVEAIWRSLLLVAAYGSPIPSPPRARRKQQYGRSALEQFLGY